MEEPPAKNIHGLDDRISFKVTEHGRQILAAHFANLLENKSDDDMAADRTVMVAKDGTVTMPVWKMVNLFGPHMHVDSEEVIFENSFHFPEQQ